MANPPAPDNPLSAELDYPRIGVVVPTRNSSRTIAECLNSVRRQTIPCRLIVVDNHSTDATAEIASRIADAVITAGPERSRQRNVGATNAPSLPLAFIDSDMVLAPGILKEAVGLLETGAAAVILPERTVGIGYWARVRAFERSFYVNDDHVEAARVFARWAFDTLAGFDESMTGPEDWDLTIRCRAIGRVERARLYVDHLEGRTRYIDYCRKKAYYAPGLLTFLAKHRSDGFRPGSRPYVKRPWLLLWPSPILGAGVVLLKGGEAVAVLVSLAAARLRVGRPGHGPQSATGTVNFGSLD